VDWIWFFGLRTNRLEHWIGFGFSMFHGLSETSDVGLDLVFGFANKPLRVLDVGLVFLHLVVGDSDIGFGFGFRVCEQTT
jgi:hypothetical protein